MKTMLQSVFVIEKSGRRFLNSTYFMLGDSLDEEALRIANWQAHVRGIMQGLGMDFIIIEHDIDTKVISSIIAGESLYGTISHYSLESRKGTPSKEDYLLDEARKIAEDLKLK